MVWKTSFRLVAASVLAAVACRPAAAEPAGPLLVDLDARYGSAGSATWKNRGSLGDFTRVGQPRVATVAGVRAVVFDGKADAYRGPVTTAALEGNAPRTVEAWVLDPRVDGPAETIVSWGRGAGEKQCFSLNVGLKHAAVSLAPARAGGAAHSGAALPWGPDVPMEDQWHHLVVTYDGTAYALYDNGARRQTAGYALKTASGGAIFVGAAPGADGEPLFAVPSLDINGKPDPRSGTTQVGGSIALAALRIHPAALTGEQVLARFNAEAGRFAAVALDALDAQRSPRPRELASVFSFGYARDVLPKDDARFDQLLKAAQGLGFNVIHATYTPERLAMCRQRGVKMMVDAISGTDHHVWATPIKWKAAAISLRNNPDVWGYNLWNDPFGDQGGTLRTHVRSLRLWDPTHPAFCGTYHGPAAAEITNGDMPGYYDFHWERGIQYHLVNCRTYMDAARRNKGMWGTWLAASPGETGDEGVRRSLWSANIAMAFGCKTFLWFLATDYVDAGTLALKPAAADIARVHKQIMPLKGEIMKLANPTAVYSTKITRDMFDKPVAGDMTAPGVSPFPAEFLVRPASGEFIAGAFDEKPGSVTLFLANYNARAAQHVKLEPNSPQARVSLFDRQAGAWRAMPVQDGAVSLELAPGGGELLKVDVDETAGLTTKKRGLVACYPFDDGFKDLTGRNPDALPRGAARISRTDKFRGAGAADLGSADGGADTDHLVIGAPNALDFEGPFTLAGWCRAYTFRNGLELLGNLPAKGGKGFALKMQSNGNWGFEVRASDGPQVLDQVHFDWAYRKYKPEAWCFFAFVMETRAGHRTLVCYGNKAGEPELNRHAYPLKVTGDLGGRQAFYIARSAGAAFDEVTVWNRSLSPAEVATLYNRGRGFDCRKLLAPPTPTPAPARPLTTPP